MGLTATELWGLCDREYKALERQWKKSREYESSLIAALRADLHNTAGKSFSRPFEPSEFLPGASSDVEERALKLIAAGVPPAEAVARASSRQSREHNLHVLDSALSQAEQRKQRGRKKRA